MVQRGQSDRIKVSGYKSIKELDLKLNSLNILIGANGAGKSNFIFIFKFLNELHRKNLGYYVPQQLGTEKFLYFGSKQTPELELSLWFSPNNYSCKLAPDSSGQRFIFINEYCGLTSNEMGYSGQPKSYPLARSGDYESGLPDMQGKSPGNAPVTESEIQNWQSSPVKI